MSLAMPWTDLVHANNMATHLASIDFLRSGALPAMEGPPPMPRPGGGDMVGEPPGHFIGRTPGVSEDFEDLCTGLGGSPGGRDGGLHELPAALAMMQPPPPLLTTQPQSPSHLLTTAPPLLSTSGGLQQQSQVSNRPPANVALSLGSIHSLSTKPAEMMGPSLSNLSSPGRKNCRLSLVTEVSPGTTATSGSGARYGSRLEKRHSRTDSLDDTSAGWLADPAYLVPMEAGYRSVSPGGHSEGSIGSGRRGVDDVSPVRCWPRTPSSCNSPVRAWAVVDGSPGQSPSPRRRVKSGVTPAALNNHLWNIFGTDAPAPAGLDAAMLGGSSTRGRMPYNMSSVMEHSVHGFGATESISLS